MSDFPPVVPQLLHTVLDAVDVRAEAEFWRDLLGLAYRSGDEVPTGDVDDADWVVLTHPDGRHCLAVQEVAWITPSSWPGSSARVKSPVLRNRFMPPATKALRRESLTM